MTKKNALTEALVDTAIAASINVPLNYFFISIAFYYGMTAGQMTIFFTIAFTGIAILRKFYVRMHFAKKHGV